MTKQDFLCDKPEYDLFHVSGEFENKIRLCHLMSLHMVPLHIFSWVHVISCNVRSDGNNRCMR